MKKILTFFIQLCFCLQASLFVIACTGSTKQNSFENDKGHGKPSKKVVASMEEFNALKPVAGDTILLKTKDWKDAQLHFKAKGTETKPVVLMAETPGKVFFTGNANLKIDGQWLVVDGLSFKDGYSLKEDVIVFSKSSSNSVLRNTSIVNYNPPAKETDYKWVSLHGKKNKVEFCELTGKSHQGTTLVVWLDETPNEHQIRNNYFGPRPALGVNGGETIRIGTSDWSMHSSKTIVEQNIFDRCDGEMEIISVKSCNNTIAENLFFECDGTLTLRHGNDNFIEGNYFIGNYKANTGGIRVIGENHVVKGNYLYALTGKGLRSSLSVMNALVSPKLNEYWPVKNTVIQENVIVQCEQAFVVGAGKNATRVVVPDSLAIINNFILIPQELLVQEDQAKRFFVSGNMVRGYGLETGFVSMPADMLRKDAAGIWQLKDNPRSLFWLEKIVGPEWLSSRPMIKIK